jgi:hypothetical protein
MYRITNEYYKKFDKVKTLFYQYSNDIDDEYMLDNENNILYLKGTETHLPGILDKTIKTFLYFKNDIFNDKYEYIVRSNVSTIVNFDNIDKITNNIKIDYGGNPIWTLAGLPPRDGIFKPEYMNTVFVQGNCIVLHNDSMKQIMNNIDEIDYNVIDDVAIGILIRFKCQNILPKLINGLGICNNCNENYSLLDNANDFTIIQNKNEDRGVDVKQMKYITNLHS